MTIKKQKRQYMDEINLRRGSSSYKYQLMRDRVANEFLECDNLDKFNSDSNLTLKNGLRMYTWYMNNKNLILSSKANVYVLIRKQLEKKKLLDEKKKEALAVAEGDNLSLAIGKKGMNVRLASRLTHYKLDVKTIEQAREVGINIVEE